MALRRGRDQGYCDNSKQSIVKKRDEGREGYILLKYAWRHLWTTHENIFKKYPTSFRNGFFQNPWRGEWGDPVIPFAYMFKKVYQTSNLNLLLPTIPQRTVPVWMPTLMLTDSCLSSSNSRMAEIIESPISTQFLAWSGRGSGHPGWNITNIFFLFCNFYCSLILFICLFSVSKMSHLIESSTTF